jgi:hypothetical protein
LPSGQFSPNLIFIEASSCGGNVLGTANRDRNLIRATFFQGTEERAPTPAIWLQQMLGREKVVRNLIEMTILSGVMENRLSEVIGAAVILGCLELLR